MMNPQCHKSVEGRWRVGVDALEGKWWGRLNSGCRRFSFWFQKRFLSFLLLCFCQRSLQGFVPLQEDSDLYWNHHNYPGTMRDHMGVSNTTTLYNIQCIVLDQVLDLSKGLNTPNAVITLGVGYIYEIYDIWVKTHLATSTSFSPHVLANSIFLMEKLRFH